MDVLAREKRKHTKDKYLRPPTVHDSAVPVGVAAVAVHVGSSVAVAYNNIGRHITSH